MLISLNPIGMFGDVNGHPNVLNNLTSPQFDSDQPSYGSAQNSSEHNDLTDTSPASDGFPFNSNHRQVMHIVIAGTAEASILYIFSRDPRITTNAEDNLDTASGVLTKVSWNSTTNEWEQVDLIRGLPVAEDNHAIKGILSDDETKLYLAVGNHTNDSASSPFFSYTREHALSGTVLAIDLLALDALPTQVDPNGGRDGLPRNYKYALT